MRSFQESLVALDRAERVLTEAFDKSTLKRILTQIGASDAKVVGGSGKLSVEFPPENSDEKLIDKFEKALKAAGEDTWGGFTSGAGVVVMKRGYVSRGDPGDPTSAHHY